MIVIFCNVFFADGDHHLWLDWNKDSLNGNNTNHHDDDPMAAMLENNAKNKNSTNIFVNQLHNSEYAEVRGEDISQGPYATTTLIPPMTMVNNLSHFIQNYLLKQQRGN